ncbi:hypothetical protein FHU33_1520 [Blastococcus colisei]|uniref:Uncharacterized protein n=1 Tax=Blastococcus colisei TaxID=1564162 RepID=A0A543PDG5_9ACTN|nr:hypothetical protein [Blastococcus colisei]TQN42126.1 hypothetical protein FHU33_1520 [Blastococcus colisei]
MSRKPQQENSSASAVDGGNGWSFRHPADPPLSPRMPAHEARDAVHKVVTEMHATGSLDAGNGDALDAWLESLRPQWVAHHELAGAEAQSVAQLAAGHYEAAALAARRTAEVTKAERDHTERLVSIFEQRLLAPNEGSARETPDRRRRPRPSIDALEGLTPQRGWQCVSILLLLLATAGDLAAFYVTLAGMTGQQAYMVWTLTIALAAAAVGVMHVVGRTARNLREGQGGLGRVSLAFMTTGWLALGAATFYVRTQVEAPTASTGQVAFGGVAAETSGEDPLLAALLLAALYIGSGILAFWIGFSDHHPRMKSYLKLRRDLAAQRRAAADAESAAIEAERLADNARAEIERTAARTAAAAASVDAEITELKELARIHVAGVLGDPAATNNLVSGRAPGEARPSHLRPLVPWPAAPADPLPPTNGKGNGNGHHAGAR